MTGYPNRLQLNGKGTDARVKGFVQSFDAKFKTFSRWTQGYQTGAGSIETSAYANRMSVVSPTVVSQTSLVSSQTC